MFFTDWRLGGIVRVRKTDGGDMRVIRNGIANIMHVKSYDANIQTGKIATFFHLFVFNMVASFLFSTWRCRIAPDCYTFLSPR